MSNLDNFFNAVDSLSLDARELYEISHALSIVGNDNLSERLNAIARSVSSNSDDARKSFAKELNDRYERDKNNTEEIIGMAITSCLKK